MRPPTTVGVALCALLVGCERLSGSEGGANQTGCRDHRTAVTMDDVLPLGFPPAQVLAFMDGQREATLRWPTGVDTRIGHVLQSPSLFFVRSERDPEFKLDIAVQCRDHLLVESPVLLKTADGQLDEQWSTGRFRSFDGQRASGTLSLKTAAIQGAYDADLASNQCLLGLQFDISFGAVGFSGNILKTVAAASCGSVGDLTGVSPHSGGSWADGV
jgi:hypothetical protein